MSSSRNLFSLSFGGLRSRSGETLSSDLGEWCACRSLAPLHVPVSSEDMNGKGRRARTLLASLMWVPPEPTQFPFHVGAQTRGLAHVIGYPALRATLLAQQTVILPTHTLWPYLLSSSRVPERETLAEFGAYCSTQITSVSDCSSIRHTFFFFKEHFKLQLPRKKK